MTPTTYHIGFVSTRLAGTDGVSLEVHKWSQILTELGHTCFYFAGESEWPSQQTYLVPEAHFLHPVIQRLSVDLFNRDTRSPDTSHAIHQLAEQLKDHLRGFVQAFNLDLLIAENVLSLPMNVPLGLALIELIAETNLPLIAHHHDFAWERERFHGNAAADYLHAAFPPMLPTIRHVVINSFASRQLALHTGASSMLIPNVIDFDSPPPALDDYAVDLRSELRIAPDEYLLLQPTRVVARKRIELAMELARRLEMKCVLVISHAAGDEGLAYQKYLSEYARLLGVRVIFAADRVDHDRGRAADGRKIFALSDIYPQADLVTYPSWVEGFGNAFLEAVYYRRPIVMSTYEIFRTDIQPKGFKVIGFEDFITDETVQQARDVLRDPALAAAMTQHNFELGRRYYSWHTLSSHLNALLHECFGID